MKIKKILSTLLLSFQALIAEPTLEDQVKAAKNPDYYIHVVLTGVVKQMIFPGPPHFLSVENGVSKIEAKDIDNAKTSLLFPAHNFGICCQFSKVPRVEKCPAG